MLGIEQIGSYIPSGRRDNLASKKKFNFDDAFIRDKIGVYQVSLAAADENASHLGIKAFESLAAKTGVAASELDVIIVVTQNPDYSLPHCSAMIHGALGAPGSCACFDISLGCSGFVYGLSSIISFMTANGMEKGVLITSDPYSKIVDPDDKNTSLLFGDAAAASLISTNPVYVPGKFTFGSAGQSYRELICEDGKLFMNGRAVFNFTAKIVPPDIRKCVEMNGLSLDDIELFLLHQGSKIIVDTIARRLELPPGKVVFDIMDCGNTISSSIPLLIEKELDAGRRAPALISGFGVGLSWASTVLNRFQH